MPGTRPVYRVSIAETSCTAVDLTFSGVPNSSISPFAGLVGHETGIYVLEGEVLTRWRERLENEVVGSAGQFLFIRAGVPHNATNLSQTTAARAVVARNDPAEQDKVIPFPP
ncbi:MAG: cupin domain-containing protein [Synechococcaceae cyanobacterium]